VTQEQIEKWKGRARLRKPLLMEREGAGQREGTTRVLGSFGLAVRADFAARMCTNAIDIGHEIKTTHGREPEERRDRCSSCR